MSPNPFAPTPSQKPKDAAAVAASTEAQKAIRATPQPPAPITVQDVKDAGLTRGDVVPAPLAPQSGTIPYAAGTVVAGVLKKFTASRTIQVAGLVLLLGIGSGLLEFKAAIDATLAAGKHVFQIDWLQTAYKALDASYKFFVGGGAMILMKLIDNDPANPPGASPAPKGDAS